MVTDYETRIQSIQKGLADVAGRQFILTVVLCLAAATLVLLLFYAGRRRIPAFWTCSPLPFVVVAARRHQKNRLAGSKLFRLKRFYEGGLRRLTGSWQGQGFSGDEFDTATHVYARDLNVLGEGSLFELLCITRTAIGRRGLADYLLKPVAREEAQRRQEAVAELRERRDLREQIAVMGEASYAEANWGTFTEWLDSPSALFSGAWTPIVLFTGIALIVLVVSLPWFPVLPALAGMLFIQGSLGLMLGRRAARIEKAAQAVSVEIAVLREGLQLIARQRFHAAKLMEISVRTRDSAIVLRKLERRLKILHECNRDWFYLPGRVLLIRALSCIWIEQWRFRNGAALREWIAAWADFEALQALANYAFENPGYIFPSFEPDGPSFQARALGNPLLPADRCVRNDIELNRTARFYVISGSNMSGKSTLLRAIGLNTVLAFAGAPVRAEMLSLSELSPCASLSVTDSIHNGKSKFLAEVDRIRHMIELAGLGRPVLFLVDEIFGGTNSRDRRAAAEAVVKTLMEKGAIGAVSTHDIALTEIADVVALHGRNVHMGSKQQGDPLDFDYLLKPGITQEANALAIARLAGVPV